MRLAIDIGNSRTKVGVFEEMKLYQVDSFDRAEDILPSLEQRTYASIIYSSVRNEAESIHGHLRALGGVCLDVEVASRCLSIKYQCSETLGADRIAAAVGARYLEPECSCLVVSVGTCVSYTIVTSDGVLLGGAISPGVEMRLRAMGTQAARLPEISLGERPPLLGRSTEECLRSGAWRGTEAEIASMINALLISAQRSQRISLRRRGQKVENTNKYTYLRA